MSLFKQQEKETVFNKIRSQRSEKFARQARSLAKNFGPNICGNPKKNTPIVLCGK